MKVYKICAQADWLEVAQAGVYAGSPDDLRDGFIHLSTAEQLEGTLRRHFEGRAGLLLIAIPAERLGPALRWEPSRAGALFPHLYGSLTVADTGPCWPLALDAAGRHMLPDLSDPETASP